MSKVYQSEEAILETNKNRSEDKTKIINCVIDFHKNLSHRIQLDEGTVSRILTK